MLTKQRQELILKYVQENGSITVAELRDSLDTSESTIRRDITALDKAGKLVKVFGGAILPESNVVTREDTVAQKIKLHREEKRTIAKYASALIRDDDYIFLDAGTTTGAMLEFLDNEHVTYVTNGVIHAQTLVAKGLKVILIGGELKASTEAVIGAQAMEMLKSFHFTKGFFGTNGVDKEYGCTTPDPNEALVKKLAISHCKTAYVVCDSTKFDQINPVTFSSFSQVTFLTEKPIPGYESFTNVIVTAE